MKAIGYVRVSTEKQADFGVSIDAQQTKIRAMAVVQGAELVDVIIDAGESAKSLQRPGMARLLALVDARAGHTATLLADGRVLMAGGDDAGVASDTLELFDPAAGVFNAVE